jgi:hypothetical protein
MTSAGTRPHYAFVYSTCEYGPRGLPDDLANRTVRKISALRSTRSTETRAGAALHFFDSRSAEMRFTPSTQR